MVPVPLPQPGLVLGESEQGRGVPATAGPNPRPPSPGLLLHDVTMAGLQELRFPEEKPLLRGQDGAELVSPPPWEGRNPGAEGALSWPGRKARFPSFHA